MSDSESSSAFCLVEKPAKGSTTFLVIALKHVKAEGEGGMDFFFWGVEGASSTFAITEASLRLLVDEKTLNWKSALDRRSYRE